VGFRLTQGKGLRIRITNRIRNKLGEELRPIPLTAAAAAVAWVMVGAATGATGPVRSRIAVLVDSSSRMLLTPEILTFTGNCSGVGMNGCTFSGNPSSVQETCNACVVDTINFSPGCASTWSSTCRGAYSTCIQSLTNSSTCTPDLILHGGLSTRGDGSIDLPGCDVDGNGLPDDSTLFEVKQGLAAEFGARQDVEFALWRHAQVEGGQVCATDAICPATPGGVHVLTCEAVGGAGNVCAFDADQLDGPTTAGLEGQCNRLTFTGSPSTFTCNACDFASTYDRAACQAWSLDRVRTGGTSPLNSAPVNCFPSANPQHRFMKYHGAVRNGVACDPAGAQQLVDFPPTGLDDNSEALLQWIDNDQAPFATASELRAHGQRPIAASLRDMRTTLLATQAADPANGCRPYRVVVIASGTESCETVGAAQTAAQALLIAGAPVYVLGIGVCPSGVPGCTDTSDLDGIASAGGTSAAYFVDSQAGLQAALEQIVSSSVLVESCNGVDDNCDGAIDENFPIGQSCQAGTGVCRDQAMFDCSADGLGVVCVPGAPSAEICNGLDDDCNGLVDDGFAAPPGVSLVSVAAFSGSSQITWSGTPGATGYDVVAGSLTILQLTGGDFAAAVSECLADDTAATAAVDSALPGPADGRWYLVRAVDCHVSGTYESGDPAQQGARNPEIAASPNACP